MHHWAVSPTLQNIQRRSSSGEQMAVSGGVTPLMQRMPSDRFQGAARTHAHGQLAGGWLSGVSAWDRLMCTLLLQAILGKSAGLLTPQGPEEQLHGMSGYCMACMGCLLPLLLDQHTAAVSRCGRK